MSQSAATIQTCGPAVCLEWSLHPPGDEGPDGEDALPVIEPGNIPRVARLMALAIHFDGLLRRGEVRDYATLARLGQVTRARMSQIMDLLCLAPDIQEALLFFPRTGQGRDPVAERDLRPIGSLIDWEEQRAAWRRFVRKAATPGAARPAGNGDLRGDAPRFGSRC